MATLKLGPVVRTTKASNRYCGPAVISALTGADTKEVARVMRHVSGRKSIIGTYSHELEKVLRLYGIELQGRCSTTKNESGHRPTLTQWLRETPRPSGTVYLVSAGNHWQLVSGRRYVCGISKEVVSIKDKVVKRRSRVRAHWELQPYRKIGLDAEIRNQIETEDQRKRENAKRYNRQMKGVPTVKKMWADLEAAGIEVEDDSINDFDGRTVRYWVFPTDEWRKQYDFDPWPEAHTVYGREGLWDIYQVYMEHMKK